MRDDWAEYAATAVCDGGIDRNPGGRMYWSVVIVDSNGDVVDTYRQEPHYAEGRRTNNVAEYRAAIQAARMLREYEGPTRILTDSLVVAGAVRKRRTRTAHLQPLLDELLTALDWRIVDVHWCGRALQVELLGH